MKIIKLFVTVLLLMAAGCSPPPHSEAMQSAWPELNSERASQLASLALGCIQREYPNKTGHVMNDESELWTPAEMHPAFYGCFDWHSSVHGHWMLVRLLRNFPDMELATEIRLALETNLTRENIAAEVDYFRQPNRKSFERTYGWAWLLKLAEELESWDDQDAKRWSEHLKPLAEEMVALYTDFLPRQSYAIRTGVHPNTAFGIAFALDYALATGNDSFAALLRERALYYFEQDRDAPVNWEPGGEDFFSPVLMEADLMTRILDSKEFGSWLEGFIPGLQTNETLPLLTPAEVSDRTDPKIVHLDGLNLSRAWCMERISRHLPEQHPYKKIFSKAAERHAHEALQHITSGNYEGEHWLASFAVYLLSSRWYGF